MNHLAENLVYLRKTNGYTQDGIADKVFVSRQAVSKWERAETSPDIETLLVLCKMYGVSVDDMLTKDLLTETVVPMEADTAQDLEQLKAVRTKQTVRQMLLWGFALFGVYALLCGILQTALVGLSERIWLIWFTLPIVPPIVFAIRFYHTIGARFIMFFVNVPFIAGIVFMLTVFYTNPAGAWIAFLSIPVYYAIAAWVCIVKTKYAKQHNCGEKKL